MKNGDITPEGYMVVYISEYFWKVIEDNMNRMTRHAGEKYNNYIALRDEPAKIEFHKLDSSINQ